MIDLAQPVSFLFSKELANRQVGETIIGLDGIARIHIGFAIGIDKSSGTLFQYTHCAGHLEPSRPETDATLAASIDVSRDNVIVALSGFGEIQPVGVRYCEQRGLSPTAESLISQTKGFYLPKRPAGHVPAVFNLKELKPPSP